MLAASALAAGAFFAVHAQLASGGPVPSWASDWNGFRTADDSLDALSAVETNGQVALTVPEKAISEAEVAYAREPLATDAIAVLGIASATKSTAILEKSRELDKRNQAIAAILLQRAAETQNTPKLIEFIDTFSRINPVATRELTGALSSTLTDPASFAVVKQALASNPPWEEAFWQKVPTKIAEVEAFYKLRLSEPGAQTSPEADHALIRVLVSHSRYEKAFALHRLALSPSQSKSPQTLDWQLSSDGQASARKMADGRISVNVQPGAGDELGRQLVRLPTGGYEISGKIEEQRGDGELSLELKCAEAQQPGQIHNVGLAELPVKVSISNASCRYWWLTLKGSAWDSSIPLQVILKEPILRPL